MNPKMTSSQLLYEKKLLSEIPSQPGRAGWGSCDADRSLHQARLRDFYHWNLTSWELPIQRYTSLVQIPNHSKIIQVHLCSACGSSSLCFLCWDFFLPLCFSPSLLRGQLEGHLHPETSPANSPLPHPQGHCLLLAILVPHEYFHYCALNAS